MRMDTSFAQHWPNATLFLRGLEARLKTRFPKVLQAFLDACMADIQISAAERRKLRIQDARTIAMGALRWGFNPFIVVDEGMIKLGNSLACGLQLSHGGSRHRLSISDQVFDPFEYGDSQDRPDNERRLEAIVLHEAVHWVRQEAAATTEAHEGMTTHEAGQLFEQLAYGRLNCIGSEIAEAFKKIGPGGREKIAVRLHESRHRRSSP